MTRHYNRKGIIGLIGMGVLMLIFFVGLYFKQLISGNLVILFPVAILGMVFCLGYAVAGELILALIFPGLLIGYFIFFWLVTFIPRHSLLYALITPLIVGSFLFILPLGMRLISHIQKSRIKHKGIHANNPLPKKKGQYRWLLALLYLWLFFCTLVLFQLLPQVIQMIGRLLFIVAISLFFPVLGGLVVFNPDSKYALNKEKFLKKRTLKAYIRTRIFFQILGSIFILFGACFMLSPLIIGTYGLIRQGSPEFTEGVVTDITNYQRYGGQHSNACGYIGCTVYLDSGQSFSYWLPNYIHPGGKYRIYTLPNTDIIMLAKPIY